MTRTSFLDRTLLAVADLSEQAVFSEAFARRTGLLQSLDVRVKLLTFVFLLVVASFLRHPGPLWVLSGLSVVLAVLSGIPVLFFVKRAWLVVPLFTAAIALPALLNVVTPGDPLWVLLKPEHACAWGPYRLPREIAVTHQGLRGAAVFVSRVTASVSLAVLLTLTTRWGDLFAGLRALFVPRVAVMTLSMTYRYLFLLLRLVQDLSRARKSRTLQAGSRAAERNWVASRIGFLFRRSRELSNQVFLAMLSRGYHGEAFSISRFRAGSADYAWSVCIALLAAALIILDRGGRQ